MKLTTFEDGIDARCRAPTKPTVARLHIKRGVYQYIVIGTAYGYLRTTGGDVRTWRSYSGARRVASAYTPF